MRKQIGISADTSGGCDSDSCVVSPTPIEGGFTTFTQIDAGSRHTVGLLDNGSLVCWESMKVVNAGWVQPQQV